MTMIGANSRTPIDTCGDTYSLMACNDVGCRRLVEMMDEFDLDSLDDLGEHIIDYSRNAVHAEIAKLPRGTWKHSMYLDGFDEPIYIEAALTVSENKIHIDFTGSGGMVRRGFNVPVCYTLAYTAFGVGCVIAKGIPNNAGSLEPISFHAPPGCILNADRPAAVFGRHLVGQMMPDLVFGCFRQFVPDRVPAEGAGAMWNVGVSGPRTSPPRIGDDYRVTLTSSGGMGALRYRDGLSSTAFPSGVRGTPVENAEALTPLIFRRKEYEQDSAGAGRSRGGFGQIIEIENTLPELFRFHAMHWRIHHPAIGFDGGHNGANGYLGLKSGPRLRGMGVQEIPAGDNLIMRTPGGAGFGNPKDRDRDLVRSDLAEGLISERAAREIYGLESNA
jgi:N-methylhydantoinase B